MGDEKVHGKDEVEQGPPDGQQLWDPPVVHTGTSDGESSTRRLDAKDARKGTRETYLGDGVYAELDREYLILRAGDGTRKGPSVWVDAVTLVALLDFLKEHEVINSYDWTAPGDKLTD